MQGTSFCLSCPVIQCVKAFDFTSLGGCERARRYVWTCVCMYVACMWRSKVNLRCHSSWGFYLGFEIRSLSRTWCLPMKLGCLHLPSHWDHKCMPPYLFFHYGCWGLNLGPHAFSISIFPAELSSRPSVRFVSDIFFFVSFTGKQKKHPSSSAFQHVVCRQLTYDQSHCQWIQLALTRPSVRMAQVPNFLPGGFYVPWCWREVRAGKYLKRLPLVRGSGESYSPRSGAKKSAIPKAVD